MALPKEPRQKMINLMYLVLTALLAINISAEILNAFKTVNTSLETTNNTVNASTATIMTSLTEKSTKEESKEKAIQWLGKATEAVNLTKTLYDYIAGLKGRIIKDAGGDPNDPSKTFNLESQSIATKIMVEGGEGKKLLQMLTDYKSKLLNIDPLIRAEFEKTLQINLETPKGQDGKTRAWDITYFNMVPTIASLTILSKFQNDIKTSENKVVAFCHNQVGKVEVVFDSYAAIVGQSSNYLMPGQELEITAGVGAFSKKAQPTISIGGSNVSIGEDGSAHFKTAGGGVGQHTIPVKISFFNQYTNKQETVDKTITYTVGQASASIELTKMNVLYIGVDNPVRVAASGGGDDKTQVSITGGGGSVTKLGGGNYNVRVGTVTDDCRINVSVDGKQVGASQFRVRTIPNSSAFIAQFESGASIPANQFKVQPGISAGIKNFPFQLDYKVASFTFSIDTDDGDVPSISCQGNLFSGPAKALMNKECKPGKTVTIDAIRVTGPDGRTTPAPSLAYYIK